MKLLLTLLLALSIAACSVALPLPVQTQNGASGTSSPTSTALPWAGLGLTGKLILILQNATGFAVTSMDLKSGAIAKLYQAQSGALVSSALVSPDGGQILLTYAPPAVASNQSSYTTLYLMPSDGSKSPQPLFQTLSDIDAYFAPTWAPDGSSIYTSHFHQGSDPSGAADTYSIDQVSLDGRGQPIIQSGQWPRLSPDGKHLSYVTVSPNNTQNDLYQYDLQSKVSTPVIKPGSFQAVDDHFYTPDGNSIIFSAVDPPHASAPSWIDRLFGVTVVSAHNIPSDWYVAPSSGGSATQLTNLGDTGMYGSLSPDHQWIAFISSTGIYVMKLDGSNLTQLATLVANGTVDWVQ